MPRAVAQLAATDFYASSAANPRSRGQQGATPVAPLRSEADVTAASADSADVELHPEALPMLRASHGKYCRAGNTPFVEHTYGTTSVSLGDRTYGSERVDADGR